MFSTCFSCLYLCQYIYIQHLKNKLKSLFCFSKIISITYLYGIILRNSFFLLIKIKNIFDNKCMTSTNDRCIIECKANRSMFFASYSSFTHHFCYVPICIRCHTGHVLYIIFMCVCKNE